MVYINESLWQVDSSNCTSKLIIINYKVLRSSNISNHRPVFHLNNLVLRRGRFQIYEHISKEGTKETIILMSFHVFNLHAKFKSCVQWLVQNVQ
jgi:hypothetical protein